MIVLDVLAAYVAAGIITAVPFVSIGIARVLPHPAPVTLGARLLLVPGAVALWPVVLHRWAMAGRRR